MATLMVFRVEFQIKKAASGFPGNADQYRLPSRVALVSAISQHPKDILTVLNADIPVRAGEVIELLNSQPVHIGSEGALVLS